MDEMFLEQMVKRGTKQKDLQVRIAIVICGLIICIVPSLFSLVVTYYVTPVLLMLVALIVWIMWRRVAKEYEYIFTNGNLDVDVIYGQSTRQHLLGFDCRQCQMIVPANSKRYEHQIYEGKYDKTIYACPGKVEENTYVILVREKEKNYRIFFEPNERLKNAIKEYSPKNTIIEPRKIEENQ